MHLDGARLEYRYRIYEGVDGRWEDVELGVADVPVPILVHRTQPASVADNWPPPLDAPHRRGAVTLAAVHLPVASIEVAADAFRRLLDVETPPALSGPGPGQRLTAFPLGSARIMLVAGGERRAVVLGVTLPSVLLLPDGDGVAWLDASATSELRLGLIETGPWDSARSRPSPTNRT